MKAILIISVSNLAYEMKKVIQLISMTDENIFSIDFNFDDANYSLKLDTMKKTLKKYNSTFVFIDLFGTQYGNIAYSTFEDLKNCTIISGFNVPMILYCFMSDELSIDKILDVGNEAILDVKAYLNNHYQDE